MIPNLIGLNGPKQCGKDTALLAFEDVLKKKYKKSVIRIAFADDVKRQVAMALNITKDEIEQNKAFYRPILQWWGTEWRRGKFGENYWIERWEQAFQVAFHLRTDAIVIAPDVRFKNEMEKIESLGGVMYKICPINRPEVEMDFHASERQFLDIDRKITNDFNDVGVLVNQIVKATEEYDD